MNIKRCPKCKIEKLVNEFYKDRNKKDGLYVWCKECHKKYYRKYKEKNKEQMRKQTKKYIQQNKELIKERSKKYYQKNKGIINKQKRKYYYKNKERIKEYEKEYRQQNKERIRKRRTVYDKAYHQRPEIIEKKNRYNKLRRYFDPKLKLSDSVSSAMCHSLKGNKNGRHWEDLAGYTLQELKIHLEKQFDLWMNWKNYGKWHIDHIKPKSLFHFTKPEDKEFKECWALSNLQPLEATKNIKKSNKFIITK